MTTENQAYTVLFILENNGEQTSMFYFAAAPNAESAIEVCSVEAIKKNEGEVIPVAAFNFDEIKNIHDALNNLNEHLSNLKNNTDKK